MIVEKMKAAFSVNRKMASMYAAYMFYSTGT